MTDPSPPAARLSRPSWRDGRLVLGVLLVLGSALGGATLLADADTSQQVWVAARDLAPGTVLAEDDLRLGKARLYDAGDRYLTGARPVGYLVTRPVAADELVPGAALVEPGKADARREVTVAVEAGHLPPDLQRSDRVDVYVTPGKGAAATGERAAARLVLSGVTVARVARAGGLASSQEPAVVLSVDPDDVLTLVQALGEGAVDLVRVP